MPYGDHLRIWSPRIIAYHHAIDIGDGTYVHFLGNNGSKQGAQVRRTTWNEFWIEGQQVEVVSRKKGAGSRHVVVNRALRLVGRGDYNLLKWTCEDLANLCVYGKRFSWQRRHLVFNLIAPAWRELVKDVVGAAEASDLVTKLEKRFRQRSGLKWLPKPSNQTD